MEEIIQQYPTFFKAGTKAAWNTLNKAADKKLGYGNDVAETYSQPIIDSNGKYWFVVNDEVSDLVDLSLCVSYESIAPKKETI
jgi:hypothetical protein